MKIIEFVKNGLNNLKRNKMKNNPPAPCTSSTIYYHKKHPKEPQCDNTVPINNEFSIIIIVVAILLFVFRKLNKKKDYENSIRMVN